MTGRSSTGTTRFHGSLSPIEGPIRPLTHFGTQGAAIARALHQACKAEAQEIWIHEALLAVRSPLRMPDIDRHSVISMIDHLHYDLKPKRLRFPANLRDAVFAGLAEGRGEEAFAKVTRDQGHDGYVYANHHEDPGSESTIIIESDQAVLVGPAIRMDVEEALEMVRAHY
jgi:hypothetical protein